MPILHKKTHPLAHRGRGGGARKATACRVAKKNPLEKNQADFFGGSLFQTACITIESCPPQASTA